MLDSEIYKIIKVLTLESILGGFNLQIREFSTFKLELFIFTFWDVLFQSSFNLPNDFPHASWQTAQKMKHLRVLFPGNSWKQNVVCIIILLFVFFVLNKRKFTFQNGVFIVNIVGLKLQWKKLKLHVSLNNLHQLPIGDLGRIFTKKILLLTLKIYVKPNFDDKKKS